jgi:hypothetical protein
VPPRKLDFFPPHRLMAGIEEGDRGSPPGGHSIEVRIAEGDRGSPPGGHSIEVRIAAGERKRWVGDGYVGPGRQFIVPIQCQPTEGVSA